MFEQPKYIQAGFSLIFPRKPDIRRMSRELEDALEGDYNPPTVLGVPDDMPAEVPRMVFDSPNGFSQLVISQATMTINVRFSPDYQIDSNLRRAYLEQKIPLPFRLLDVCSIDNPSFAGVNWVVRIGADGDSDRDVIRALTGNLLSVDAEPTLYDLEVKRVEVLESRYFFNSTFANYRQWGDDQQLGVTRRPTASAIGRGVQITLDFNDRFSFNEIEGYRTNLDTALDILSKAYEKSDATIMGLTRNIA